jgi:hypothetical protein
MLLRGAEGLSDDGGWGIDLPNGEGGGGHEEKDKDGLNWGVRLVVARWFLIGHANVMTEV